MHAPTPYSAVFLLHAPALASIKIGFGVVRCSSCSCIGEAYTPTHKFLNRDDHPNWHDHNHERENEGSMQARERESISREDKNVEENRGKKVAKKVSNDFEP